ncbi:MAG: hypothetical protein JRD89_14460 [Deltaproteobacteria bacterium]|nr:hypothetical protein [Deltaproteobacteria bacterium]
MTHTLCNTIRSTGLKSFLIPFDHQARGLPPARHCPYAVRDQRGDLNCLFYDGSVGYCSPDLCPRLNMRRRRRSSSSGGGIDRALLRLSGRRRGG